MRDSTTTVLIIESHPLMREALSLARASEPGLTVAGQLAASADVVPLALALLPDLILLALGNPGREDLQALGALRQALPVVPIVALTTDEVVNQEQVALQRGASIVVTKTAPCQELLLALHGHFSNEHSADRNLFMKGR